MLDTPGIKAHAPSLSTRSTAFADTVNFITPCSDTEPVSECSYWNLCNQKESKECDKLWTEFRYSYADWGPNLLTDEKWDVSLKGEKWNINESIYDQVKKKPPQ